MVKKRVGVTGILGLLLAISLAAVPAMTTGCAAKHAVAGQQFNHPNSISALDDQAYDVLMASGAALDQAKKEVVNGTLPVTSTHLVNQAGAAYNTARATWLLYRHTVGLVDDKRTATVITGDAGAPVNDQEGVTSNVDALATKLQVDLVALKSAIAQLK